MTLDAATATSTTPAKALPDFIGEGFLLNLLKLIGTLVNFELWGVEDDLSRWLGWMLIGGKRPKPTKRATYADGTNGYRVAQNAVCALLEYYAHLLNWDDPAHFKLIERATRPLPGTKPLGQPAGT